MLLEQLESHIRDVPDFPKPGILFKDITPIFKNPELCKEIVQEFANTIRGEIDLVCGIESRGFIFGFPLALELNVPFVLIRKKGKLPPPVISQSYELEYGSAELEIIEGQIKEGQRVLIHDDVLATGGTAYAAAELVEKQNAQVTHFCFLASLDFLLGKESLTSFNATVNSLISY